MIEIADDITNAISINDSDRIATSRRLHLPRDRHSGSQARRHRFVEFRCCCNISREREQKGVRNRIPQCCWKRFLTPFSYVFFVCERRSQIQRTRNQRHLNAPPERNLSPTLTRVSSGHLKLRRRRCRRESHPGSPRVKPGDAVPQMSSVCRNDGYFEYPS